MPTTSRKILIVVLVVLLCGVTFVSISLWWGWRWSNEVAYMSCISSLTDAVLRQEAATAIQEKHDEWKVLDDLEFNRVMSNVTPGDCGPTEDLKLDPWQNRIHIALRKTNKTNWPPIIIWSDGRDGVPSTEDDIIVPYGQKIPR